MTPLSVVPNPLPLPRPSSRGAVADDALERDVRSVEDAARDVLRRADASSLVSSGRSSGSAAADLRSRAESVARKSLRLRDWTATNAARYRRSDSSAWTSAADGGDVVSILGDAYAAIRELESRKEGSTASGEGGKWVAPASFERATTKYWVEDDRLHEVMLASVAELPLLVYGRKGEYVLYGYADGVRERRMMMN